MAIKPLSILLVENNIDHVEITLSALENNGMVKKVDVVYDGEEALDYLYNRGKYENTQEYTTPDLILLDISLPKLSGLEVLQDIKTDSKLKIVPVVMLTTSSESRDIDEAYTLGANSYITKPIGYKEFIDKVFEIKSYWSTRSISAVDMV